jgi:MFS superfamily sulfate permease-like transporter
VHFREEVSAALEDAPDHIRVLVLDTIGMSDLDFTGARALGRVLSACERDHITFALARSGEHLRKALRRSGLASRIGEDRFYPSVNEAVVALTRDTSPP